MLCVTTIVNKHCNKMEHSYIKHPCDNENKNVLSIHRSEYMSVVVLGCLVMTTLCLQYISILPFPYLHIVMPMLFQQVLEFNK